MTTSYTVPDDPKMLRETLCVVQGLVLRAPDDGRKREHGDRLQRLINECDRHRPTGPNGKHGDRHTPTCGCEDVPGSALTVEELADAQPRQHGEKPCSNPSCPLRYAHRGPCAPLGTAGNHHNRKSSPMDLHDFCVFCEIIAGRAPATIVKDWPNALAIVPLEPVTEGHVLVMPKDHSADFTTGSEALLWAMMCAAQLAREMHGPMNMITSKGAEATQSVFHLHLHLIPRRQGDGLALPWTDPAATSTEGISSGGC